MTLEKVPFFLLVISGRSGLSGAKKVRNRSAGSNQRKIDGGAGRLRGYSETRADNRKAKRTIL